MDEYNNIVKSPDGKINKQEFADLFNRTHGMELNNEQLRFMVKFQ